YGCSLISSDRSLIASLSTTAYDLVFKEGLPPEDILLREYALGIIERANHLECMPKQIDLIRARPPYNSRWPISAPTEQTIRTKLSEDKKDWHGLFSSLFTMGDFRRYVVEHPEDIEYLVRDINQFRMEGDETTAYETEKTLERFLAETE
ncbi:MAG: hypothetical protein IH914_07315, partial [candidate division Zixibacteria bacterium]|nr:hypothetical protein [candidate division Zixibacteria bacterium]